MIKHTLIINPACEEQALIVTTNFPEDEGFPSLGIRIWDTNNESVEIDLPLHNAEAKEGALKVVNDITNALSEVKEKLLKYEVPKGMGLT